MIEFLFQLRIPTRDCSSVSLYFPILSVLFLLHGVVNEITLWEVGRGYSILQNSIRTFEVFLKPRKSETKRFSNFSSWNFILSQKLQFITKTDQILRNKVYSLSLKLAWSGLFFKFSKKGPQSENSSSYHILLHFL